MEGTSNIGAFVQEHPQILIGGALVAGLVLFLGTRSKPAEQQTSLEAIDQSQPGPDYITADELTQLFADNDERMRAFIESLGITGGGLPPDPAPIPYPVPLPGGEGDPGPNPDRCPPGQHWNGRQCVLDGGEGGGTDRRQFCPPGYVWNVDQGMCVQR